MNEFKYGDKVRTISLIVLSTHKDGGGTTFASCDTGVGKIVFPSWLLEPIPEQTDARQAAEIKDQNELNEVLMHKLEAIDQAYARGIEVCVQWHEDRAKENYRMADLQEHYEHNRCAQIFRTLIPKPEPIKASQEGE